VKRLKVDWAEKVSPDFLLRHYQGRRRFSLPS
jgi:hypothetical protein